VSYILDALRKSERDRKRATVPDPLSVQEPLPSEKKPRPVRSYLVVVTVLLGTLISGLWFGIWYAKRPPVKQASVNQTVTESRDLYKAQGVEETNSTSENEHNVSKNNIVNAGRSVQDKSDPKSIKKVSENPVRSGESKYHEMIPDVPASTPPAHDAEKDIPSPDKNRLYSLQELPNAIRQKLPDFSFSVFLYTDEPSSRTVRVNGVLMREGQYVTDGLKLEEIIPDGVIFSYMDYRFRIGIP
jgi:general secretion pathway protein B